MTNEYFYLVFPPDTKYIVLQNDTIWCAKCFISPHRGYIELKPGTWVHCLACEGKPKIYREINK